jgi:hypothetical protein
MRAPECALCEAREDGAPVVAFRGVGPCRELVPYLWKGSGLVAHRHCAGWMEAGGCECGED